MTETKPKVSIHKRTTVWDATNGVKLKEKAVTVDGEDFKECSDKFDKLWKEE